VSQINYLPEWPDGKEFAFSIIDDPDSQWLSDSRTVYAFLEDHGFRTTKAIWPVRRDSDPTAHGETCDNPAYVEFCLALKSKGFELALHNVSYETSSRAETVRGLDIFRKLIGQDPVVMANHYNSLEAVYWGSSRLNGLNRLAYNLITGYKNHHRWHGHEPKHPLFWGDLCKSRIKYVRNFVFHEINTLRACPFLPYYDPKRPFVQSWFAGSDGSDVRAAKRLLSPKNLDRLQNEGGLCILYCHLGHGFVQEGHVEREWAKSMERLSKMNGWYVPVGTVLDFIAGRSGISTIDDRQRSRLERRWLRQKLWHGTS
jgi:hypothetical protein